MKNTTQTANLRVLCSKDRSMTARFAYQKRKRSFIGCIIFISVRVLFEFTIFTGCRFDYDLYRGVDGEKIIAICLVLSDKF